MDADGIHNGQVIATYRTQGSRRPKLTPEERKAARDAALAAQREADIALTLAEAPPPSAWQLQQLARLCAHSPINRPVRRTA